ncbi:MAG: glycosyltransferase family 4 protein [Candidatus Polarisedimenticolia bacterium]
MTVPYRILVVHDRYSRRGGEDTAVEAEIGQLRGAGHEVLEWFEDNQSISGFSIPRKASLMLSTSWSSRSHRRMLELIERFRPDIVHFHNLLPLISPSAIHAAATTPVAVVMTLHNYRLICPAGTLFRDGRPCEECSSSLLNGIGHACYRGSALQTSAIAGMLLVHRMLGTWNRKVDAFIALTDFMRGRLVEAGLPRERVHIKSNSCEVALVEELQEPFVLFVGRLSAEKGIDTVLAAFSDGLHQVKIIGDGPLMSRVLSAARSSQARIESLGEIPHAGVIEYLRRASVLVFPSQCYEGMPLVLVEALGAGVPVVASRIGAIPDIIREGQEGFLFPPGDATELARLVSRISGDPSLRTALSKACRKSFETRFSPQVTYEVLMSIYDAAIAQSRERRRAA